MAEGLSQIGNFISINGYVTNEYFLNEKKGVPNTFDQHYFNLFVSGELNERILAEIQLEYETWSVKK